MSLSNEPGKIQKSLEMYIAGLPYLRVGLERDGFADKITLGRVGAGGSGG